MHGCFEFPSLEVLASVVGHIDVSEFPSGSRNVKKDEMSEEESNLVGCKLSQLAVVLVRIVDRSLSLSSLCTVCFSIPGLPRDLMSCDLPNIPLESTMESTQYTVNSHVSWRAGIAFKMRRVLVPGVVADPLHLKAPSLINKTHQAYTVTPPLKSPPERPFYCLEVPVNLH
jgi:hypothetical protein